MARKLFLLLLVVLVGGLFLPLLSTTPVCGMTGSGTAEDPYLIYDVDDLQAMSLDLDAYYELANNIDASNTSNWNGGLGFAPINYFTGSLDGNYYSITDLYIDRIAGSVGLFGAMNAGSAVIKNLYILDAYVKIDHNSETHCNAGILIGASYEDASPQVSRVIVSGAVYAYHTEPWGNPIKNAQAGGLIGFLWEGNALIEKCASYANVTASQDGYGYSWAGGLIGAYGTWYGSAAYVKNCFARGYVYGLIGDHYSGAAGGFIGYQHTNDTGGCYIQNSYSTGEISGNVALKGFLGTTDYPSCTTHCFWDIETSGTSSSATGTGKNTTDMKIESTFTDVDWDFETIWGIITGVNDGYPYFIWTNPTLYVLYITSSAGGNVTDPGEGYFYYGADAVVSLNASPDSEYEFYRWVWDTSTIEDIYSSNTTITMSDSYAIAAVFMNPELLPMPTPILPLIKPPGMEADPEDLPWYDIVHPAAVGLEWRTLDLWAILIIFIAIGIGVGVMIATGSTLLAAVSVAIVLVVGVNMCVVSWWVVIVYAIFAGSYLVAVRTM